MSDKTNSIELSIGNISLTVSGSAEFVKQHFYQLRENHGLDEIEVSDVDIDVGTTNGRKRPELREEEDSGSGIDSSLNEILKDSEISQVKDKALLVGWYLETVHGQDDFTRVEVEKEARRSKVSLGENVGRDIGRYQVEDGHIAPGDERDGEETFWVTNTGLEYLREKGVPA